MKFVVGLLAGLFLFSMTMIDTRGQDITGTCVVDGFEIYPVVNHDCKGTFYE